MSERRRDAGGRLSDLDHRHPDAGASFGAAFQRGPTVADGGTPRNDRVERLADVEHASPHGDGTNAVWERGEERRGDDAADEVTDDE